MRFVSACIVGACMLCFVPTSRVFGATRTWQGADVFWTNTANWSGGTVPANGDDVVVPVTGTDPEMPAGTNPPSGSYLSLTVNNGASVMCLGDVTAINEDSGGTLGDPHGIGVTISVSGDAVIDGALNADGQGFTNQLGPGASGNSSQGGSYGGRGAMNAPAPYGLIRQPTALGSGGFFQWRPDAGGGAIKLVVGGDLDIDGSITARGVGDNTGGSGGSVWLICSNFSGSGLVSADGGYGQDWRSFGSGGGGRVAIEYSNSTFNGLVSVAGGPVRDGTYKGRPGTLWEPGRYSGTETVVIGSNAFNYWFPDEAVDYLWSLTVTNTAEVYFSGLTNGSLTITNILLQNSALKFEVGYDGIGGGTTMFNNVSVSGVVAVSGVSTMGINNGTHWIPVISVSSSHVDIVGPGPVYGLTNISLSDSTLCLPPGTYNLSGDFVLPTNSTIYAKGDVTVTNEASGGGAGGDGMVHGAGVVINVESNISIMGELTAYKQGFPGRQDGYPGPGNSDTALSAGGYGGRGGRSVAWTYGSLAMPSALGSGSYYVDRGGGAIKLVAGGTIDVQGTVSSIGVKGSAASGSGGSLWLVCETLSGGGVITAQGAEGGRSDFGAGGGGRLALDCGESTFSGMLSVAGGYTPGWDRAGETGTLFNCKSPWRNVCSTGAGGASLQTSFSHSGTNIVITREILKWNPQAGSFAWKDNSTDFSYTTVTNQATYSINGLSAGYRATVYDNGGLYCVTNSDAQGILSFVISLDGEHTIVIPAPKGSLFIGR